MKKTTVFLIFMISFNFYSQNDILKSPIKNSEIRRLIIEEHKNDDLFLNQKSANNIFLTQIGNMNEAYTTINSSESTLNILQEGNKNNIDINLKANKISGNILQKGNYNKITDYNYVRSEFIDSKYSQMGNNLTIEKFGSNSLTDAITINLKGNNRTVLIRSYK
ncbi:hypothetical protein K8354_04795 [Polaribacter litorisediminis]|uniref:hypothetical protein n=1 Tax=Polaribacter litorisediminis TaxID=1908341 RepID=UPI001CBC17D9|nr:hypothetical protein [Polaribacter litorisediminis]UAM99144.1 hypothetical protein K8354_04795 [Polaribacter litorisediminis]